MSLPGYSSGGTGATAPAPYVRPAAPQPSLPNASWTKPVAARDNINATATKTEDQQIQVVAAGSPLRVIYGPGSVAAQIADVLVYQGKLIVFAVWGEGENDAVVALLMNNKALPAAVTATHYTGTAGQTADPTLVAAYAAQGIVYADALPGICYSVIAVPEGASEGFPTFVAQIQGRKLYDPRTGLTVYSDNPALATADCLSNTTYGFAKTVDWTSVETVADDDDALVGGEKRRIIGLVCDTPQDAGPWIDTLRTYASCFVVQGNVGVKLISDRPGSSVFSFGSGSGAGTSKIVEKTLKLKKAGRQQIPTVMRIEYTNTTKTPWFTDVAEVLAAGVAAGTTPRRESTISLVGLQRYSQAVREGIERLNKLTLGDLSAEFVAFDEAMAVEVGDITDVTHPVGLSGKLVRVNAASVASPGRPKFGVTEYDPAMYSDVVTAEPTYADTSLPDPAEPPLLTGFDAVEEVYQMQNGIWASRLKLTWNVPDYPFLQNYRVEVWSGTDLIVSAAPTDPLWRSGPVKEGVLYVCKAFAVTVTTAVGEPSQKNVTALGKYLIPGDVPSVTAFEAGGEVFAQCTPAVDVDIWRYEWRYWSQTGGYTWTTGNVIDRADSLRCRTKQIPVGDWVLGVKAIDSVGQYSENAATTNVSVTSDAAAFFVDTLPFETPTLTNMAAYTLARTDPNTYYVTEDGVAWDTKFSAAMDTYTDPLATYHNSVTSTWESEGEDYGQILSGQWTGTATVAAINGSLISYIGLSDDDSIDPYDWVAGLSRKATGRFAKLKHESLTTSTLSVTVPTQNIRLDVVPREERLSGTTSATGATTVPLSGTFTDVIAVIITPLGTTDLSYAIDNIVMGAGGSFDLRIFDAGAQVACSFLGIFKGV